MRTTAFALGILLTCGSAEAQTPIRTTPAACAQLAQLQVPGIALTVAKAAWVEAGAPMAGGRAGAPPVATQLPAYCRLDGIIDRRVGAAGTAYGIGFALAMPENWNGRFLFQGGGGLNGSVQPPLGGSAAGGTPGLARGFAVVSTDTGHQGRGGFDASFTQDQQANLDFAYAAVGRVADVSKRILAQHYGRPPARSYFAGCSTGGREAMLMAQRYPLSFDGVVAGAPAMRTSFSGIGDRWVAATLNEVAPKNAQGQPVTRDALSERDKTDGHGGPRQRLRCRRRLEGRADLQRQRLQVRPEDARLQRSEGGRLPVDGAGNDAREGVRWSEGLERAAGVSRLSVRHRHRRDARTAGPAARWPASGRGWRGHRRDGRRRGGRAGAGQSRRESHARRRDGPI